MVIRHTLDGYEKFTKFMKTFDSKGKNVHIYFGGSKKDGVSWCLNCVKAEAIIEKCLEKVDPETYFIHVEIGDSLTFRDPQNPFRTDPKTKIMVVPTLIRWNGPQRLSGTECNQSELVEMLFNDTET